jgi:hypothetical protein
MTCPTCGSELDAAGSCSQCSPSVAPAAPVTATDAASPFPNTASPLSDAYAPAAVETPPNRWKAPLFTLFAIIFFTFMICVNYLRALRWAGVMNAGSFGYMLGGILFSSLLGVVVMYVVQKVRGKKTSPESKALTAVAVAFSVSVLALLGETGKQNDGDRSAIYHKAGNLLKEAAGKEPRSADVNWWDAPSRDFFRDILEMNQRYAAEVAALDTSAIKDLYSSKSYGGDVHMQKVITQLKAVQAVDENYYGSLEPLIEKLKDRIAAVNIPEEERQEFLKGLRENLDQKLGPRSDLFQKEEAWLKSTIGLYDFAIAHISEYFIRDNKLYFHNDATKRNFISQQAKAVELHKDFLKGKKALEESRKNSLNKMGLSPSDFTPAQLGKPR